MEKLAGPLLEEYLHIKVGHFHWQHRDHRPRDRLDPRGVVIFIVMFLQDLEATIKEIAEKFHTATIVGFVEAVLNRWTLYSF